MTEDIGSSVEPLLPRPRTRRELRRLLREALGITVPDRPLIEGHASPMDYLAHTFFEPKPRDRRPRDAVVWAARGSGKTYTAALATALDLVFKPGVEVRLLAGSLEQGRRMHDHLRSLFAHEALAAHLATDTPRPVTDRRVLLANGSRAELSAASQASVRGSRPQKLRIDEADVLSNELYAAAQLTTRSATLGGTLVVGAIDTLSTWHHPAGPMSTLIDPVTLEPLGGRALYRFSAVDVLERCPAKRACAVCPLEPDCDGAAKRARGHLPIDDAVTMKQRAGGRDWSVEMLCERPSRSSAVLPEFDPRLHVRSAPDGLDVGGGEPIAGMDFGWRNPTVILFARALRAHAGSTHVHVTHELVERALTLDTYIEALRDPGVRFTDEPPPAPRWVGVDPAGNQRHEQTGASNVQVMRRAGLDVRWRRATILGSLRLVQRRLAPADGPATITVHPRCATLIHALTHYHYPSGDPSSVSPVKDGHDHPIDALRYMLLCLDAPHTSSMTRYA